MERYSIVKADRSISFHMAAMLRWVERFLCGTPPNQHVVGNRRAADGQVVTQADYDAKLPKAHGCPFVQRSLDLDNFWFEESPFTETDQGAIESLLLGQVPAFLAAAPAYDPSETGRPAGDPDIFKSFLIVFPRVTYSKGSLPLFDAIQNSIKVEFIRCGMMLGQFYYGCPQEGLYNPRFRPLSAPWPAFALRYMVKDDLAFNKSKPDWLEAYRQYFP